MVQSLRRSKSFRILFNSPELVEEQRSGFHHFLKHGIAEELSKISFLEVKRQNVDIEVFLDASTFQLIAPNDNSRNCILKMKTYACKLYVQIRIVWKKKSGDILMQTEPEWVLLAHLPMMTKRGHFVINGSPRVIVHQVVRAPGVYFQKFGKVKKDERNKARFYGDIIPRKGVWVRLQISKTGQVEIKLKKSTKVQAEMVERCLAVIERQELSKKRAPKNELLLSPFGLMAELVRSKSCRNVVPATQKFKRFFPNRTELGQMSNSVQHNVSPKIADCSARLICGANSGSEGPWNKQDQVDPSSAWVHRVFGLLLGCFANSAASRSARWIATQPSTDFVRTRTRASRELEPANREFFRAQQPKEVDQKYRPRVKSMAITGFSKAETLRVAQSKLAERSSAETLRYAQSKLVLQRKTLALRALENQPTVIDGKRRDGGVHGELVRRKSCQNRTFVVRARTINAEKVTFGQLERTASAVGSRSAKTGDLPERVKLSSLAPLRSRLQRDPRAGPENTIASTGSEAIARQSRAGRNVVPASRFATSKDLSDKFVKAELKSDDRAFTNVYDNLYRVPEMKELEDKMYPKGCYIPIDTEFKRDFSYKHIFATFKAPWRYSLGKVGRHKLNKKFGLDVIENQLTSLDVQAARNWLYRLRDGKEIIDDIDHFQNRRVRQSGELIQNQFENGVTRLRKLVRRKLRSPSFESLPFGSNLAERGALAQSQVGSGAPTWGLRPLEPAAGASAPRLVHSTRRDQTVSLCDFVGRSPVTETTFRLAPKGPKISRKAKLRLAKQNFESEPAASAIRSSDRLPSGRQLLLSPEGVKHGFDLESQRCSGRISFGFAATQRDQKMFRRNIFDSKEAWQLLPALRLRKARKSSTSALEPDAGAVRSGKTSPLSRPSAPARLADEIAPETAGFIKLTRAVGVIVAPFSKGPTSPGRGFVPTISRSESAGNRNYVPTLSEVPNGQNKLPPTNPEIIANLPALTHSRVAKVRPSKFRARRAPCSVKRSKRPTGFRALSLAQSNGVTIPRRLDKNQAGRVLATRARRGFVEASSEFALTNRAGLAKPKPADGSKGLRPQVGAPLWPLRGKLSSPSGANRPPVGKGLRPQVGASLPTSPSGANRPPVGKALRAQVGASLPTSIESQTKCCC
jgi:hypothetical protein